MTDTHPPIYHIVPESKFLSGLDGQVFAPSDLPETGFVHCALRASVVPVANDYFSGISGPVLLLEIDPGRLRSATRYEAPAPLSMGASSHLASAQQFPHVYGPINRDAITGVGFLERKAAGFEWPRDLIPLEAFLSAMHSARRPTSR